MRYKINMGAFRTSTIITSDETVVWASEAFRWSIGCTLQHVLDWVRKKRGYVECTGVDSGPTVQDLTR